MWQKEAHVPLLQNEDTLSIMCNGQVFILKIGNIISYEYKMDVEIENSIQNGSVLKGMIGGAVFGIRVRLLALYENEAKTSGYRDYND